MPKPTHSKAMLTALSAAIVVVLVAAAARPVAADFEGVPTVIDGDTMDLGGLRLELHGVDAPELGQQCALDGRLYDCGMVARTALLDLTAGAKVVCKKLGAGPEGTTLARCFADDYDLSEGMAYTGWALATPTRANPYATLEAGARRAGRGLWRGRFVAPWDWRAGRRLPDEDAD